jgi:formylglycine-generating enzyme required for sulfatase activity
MPVIFTKDDLRSAVEAATGGQQTVLYDDKGYPTIVQIIPKFNLEDVNPALGSGVHPAFVVGGVEKSQIYIAVYPAAVVDGRAVSIAGKAPANYVTYDQAVQYCASKGVGWHLMTNWEWAALALWCVKNEFQPRGNTYWRRSHAATFETGGSVDGRGPGVVAGDGRTFGGSGPASWRHNNSFQGIADLVGNVWEWQGGLKIVDGQIYMPNDNDFTLAEAQWPAQGVYFDASAGPGDGNGAAHNGTPILSNGITKYSETPTPAGGGDERDLDYAHISGASGWQGTGLSSGYNGLTAAVRQRMAQALIAPKLLSGDSAVATAANGAIWVRNYGERFPIRGGPWASGADDGLAALHLNVRRVYSDNSVGFRPAFSA